MVTGQISAVQVSVIHIFTYSMQIQVTIRQKLRTRDVVLNNKIITKFFKQILMNSGKPESIQLLHKIQARVFFKAFDF